MTTELTAGEQAYLDSGGTDATGLIAENQPASGGDAGAGDVAKVEPAEVSTETPAPAKTEAPAADTPEPGEEEIPAADGKTKRRMVDSRALKAEREKARTLEAELTKERDTRARVDERLKMLSEAVSAAEPAAEAAKPAPIPDPETDIFGYAKYLAEQLEALKGTVAGAQAETAEERATRAAESQTRAVVSAYRQDAGQFKTKQPDFDEAYNFLIGLRKTQLEAQRYSPEDVAKWLQIEEMNLVQRAFEAKTSPAADIYNLAKSMGYAPKAAAAVAAAAPAAAAKPAPAAPLAAVANVTDEIDRIKAGKAASMSLSNGGGSAGEELSLEWLADAPLNEFQAFMDKPGNRARVEKAMGSQAA